MDKENRKVKIEIEFDVPTYTSDDGTVFQITNNELENILKHSGERLIDQEIISKEQHIIVLDRKHEFMQFKPNCKNLIYDESNPETYKHFVHWYLKNYYVDSYNSRHYTNGGNWQNFAYDVEIGLHNRMLTGEFIADNYFDLSVRDLIIVHLISGRGVRMYGIGQHYRRVKKFESVKEQKEFWKWVFDSKMLDPNGIIPISDRLKSFLQRGSKNYNDNYDGWLKREKTIASLIFQKCWRDENLETLNWIVEKYGLDFYKADKIHSMNNKNNCSLGFYIIGIIHDDRIHNTYNNDVLSRKYTYKDKKELSQKEKENNWAHHRFYRVVNFISWLGKEYPLLPYYLNLKDENSEKYKDILDMLKNGLLRNSFGKKNDKGLSESVHELFDLVKKGIQ